MKGQLTSEYLVSFVIFALLVSYIYLSYSANIPAFVEEVRKEDIRSKAFQLSEILINDPGEPKNWYYIQNCDVNNDGVYNITDINIISCFFGVVGPLYCKDDCPMPCCPQCDIHIDNVIDIFDVAECSILFMSNIKRIGFSDHKTNKQNLILMDKILSLTLPGHFDCADKTQYEELQKKLDLDKQFSILISEIKDNGNREVLYVCNPPTIISDINVTITRIVAINDTITNKLKLGEVIIQM